mgnify:CR=1 FL=1
MARVRQTARKRAVGSGKSRAKAAAVNAGAEAESETESESESESDGFGQADAESEAPSPAAFCAPGAEPAAKLWSFSTVVARSTAAAGVFGRCSNRKSLNKLYTTVLSLSSRFG